MNNGLGYKLANVPTITGLSTVTADAVVSESINTDSLYINGVDVSGVITQVPINTANIAILQQLTTGISYSDTGGIDLTTVDNNLTVTNGKKLKSATVPTDNDDMVNKLFLDNALVNITGITYSNSGGIDLTTIDNNVTISSGKKLKSATVATANDDVTNKLFVDTAIANLVASAPATLDTLNELAAALGDDPNFATTVTNLIAGKVSLTGNETISGEKIFNNLARFQLANILVDNAGGTITCGNGGSTATANIVLSKLTTATAINFNAGNNTLVGPRVGNSMVVGSSNNTYIGDRSGFVATGSNNTLIGSNAGQTLTTGSNNICIGRDAAVPTLTGSNQISIGTTAETMLIQGGHNWRFFTAGISANITLTFPFHQIYPIIAGTPITITLPIATSGMIGAHFIFRKVINNQVITIQSGGSPAIVPYNGLGATASITMSTTQFQTELLCNGAVYYQVNTDLPNAVLTDTTQNISGSKTFSATTNFGDNITLNNVNQNNRQINNTVYNLYDGTAVAGGLYRAKLYSTASTITFDLDTPTAFGIYTAGANNIFNVSVSDCTIKTTNCPSIIGFTLPGTGDSTSKIATTAWVQSALPSTANFLTTNTAQNITAIKTFSDTSIIFTDATPITPKATTLKQNTTSGKYEMTQNYVSGGFNFISKDGLGNDKIVSMANATITAQEYRIFDGLNFASQTYISPNYTIENSANGDIIFKTNGGTTQFTINNTNCSFTQAPLCSVAPTTANMLCNKNYVDTLVSGNYVTLTTTQTVSGQKAFTNASNTYAGSGASLTGVVHTTGNQTVDGTKTFNGDIILSDGGTNNSTIDQLSNQFNIQNNIFNNTILTITGLIPSVNFGCLVRTDSVSLIPNYGQITAGVNIDRTYFNNFYVGTTTTQIAGLNLLTINTVNSNRPLLIGETILTEIGTYYTVGTYILADLGSGNFQLSKNALVATSPKVSVNLSYTPLNRAYLPAGAAAGSITFDYNNTTHLKIHNQSSVMLNAISIKPSLNTSNIHMFGDVSCRGQLNYNVGPIITANITLATPICQHYPVAMATATRIITLPVPTDSTVLGCVVTFKRRTNTTAFSLAAGAGSPFLSTSSIVATATFAFGTTLFQATLVCDGVNWCVVSQA